MECEFRAFDTPRRQTAEHALSEVQTGCRRGDRPTLASINRLITIAIGQAILAPDVRRQRHVADPIDRLDDVDASVGPQAYRPAALKVSGEDLAVQPCAEAFEHDPGPGFSFWPGCISASHRTDIPAPLSSTPGSSTPNFPLPDTLPVASLPMVVATLGAPSRGVGSWRINRHSTAPPPGRRCPSRRAGNTFVLFKTRRSPWRRYSARCEKTVCSTCPLSRCNTSRRESPRLAGGSCAISSSGRSKSKSRGHHDLARDPRPSP